MRKKTTNKEESVEHDASDQTKPWNKQFDDDRDDDGNLSRLATRKKKHGGSVLAICVWVALALVIIIPVTWFAIHNNTASNSGGDYTNDKIAVSSTAKKASAKPKHSSSSSAKSSAKSSSEKPQSSSAASSTQSSSGSSSTYSTSSSIKSSSSSLKASSSSVATGTYTVKRGDNLYRIAVNHGMTLAQLLQLNGLSSGSSISAGTVLKVQQ
ncbi:LysM peptidoglycan-binding domain-containing protein [Lacticaseibacillus jixiensis]|uniref:LysM peptidoglycan-binding domain-containing protein n=1 Tax=Lacticaseibacillus jixiensis TaxID=3231926 RepID=UPI0036F1FE51